MLHGTGLVSILHNSPKPIKTKTEKKHKSKLFLNKWGKQKVVNFFRKYES
jgi:hypothetical protein